VIKYDYVRFGHSRHPIHTDDESVVLRITSDQEEVRALLDRRLQVDPVRATVLGTIRLALDLDEAQCWCAATLDGSAVAVRSNQSYPVVLNGDWPVDDVDQLATAVGSLPALVGISGAPATVRSVAARMPITITRAMTMRLYRLETLNPPSHVAGRARRADADDTELIRKWYEAFNREAGGVIVDVRQDVAAALRWNGCWLWMDAEDAVVSLATRRPVVAGSARIGPVYTPTNQRKHGYGSAVTAAATLDILSDGGVPVLFADLANPTTNDIYSRLGYQPVEDRLQVDFT
jgi:FR47-like protein